MPGKPPPAVHVAPHVMRRIRTAQTVSERTLAIFAASSFATAVMTAAIGFLLLPEFDNPLAAFLQIVPPIGL